MGRGNILPSRVEVVSLVCTYVYPQSGNEVLSKVSGCGPFSTLKKMQAMEYKVCIILINFNLKSGLYWLSLITYNLVG